ncbi:ABC transporter substrate-binding protein [Rhodobacterales bacterium]|nr:ABC transporter substrate-binding protein [Rhodobacterales bacterium]
MTFLKNAQLPGVLVATALALGALALPSQGARADDAGGEAAQRIVAVGGSVTEIVYALGEEDRLIARDSTSTFPEEAGQLPDVGYMRALSPEGVMSVNPDLILMLEGSGPEETVELLHKSGVGVADIPDDHTAAGILEKVRKVGDALGVPEKAEALTEQLKEELAAAHAAAEGKTEGTRVLFILSTRGGRILAAGSDTAADGILQLAGAENAVAGFSGYKPLSDEAILSAAPDVVLMMERGGNHGAEDANELFAHPALGQTPAGLNRQLIRMPGGYLLGFGPRTAGAIRDLADRLAEARG